RHCHRAGRRVRADQLHPCARAGVLLPEARRRTQARGRRRRRAGRAARGGIVTGPLVAIVADDLTGAGDTAVQFVRAGWVTQLSMGGADEALSGAGARAEVLAVTTNSRAMAPAAAG